MARSTVSAELVIAGVLSFISFVIAFQFAVFESLRLWLSFDERFLAVGISLHALFGQFFV